MIKSRRRCLVVIQAVFLISGEASEQRVAICVAIRDFELSGALKPY